MPEAVKVSQVFVPGKLPDHTYNPRPGLHLESKISDYVEEAGAILTLAGPTKTGKSVLLRRMIKNPVWVDGQEVGAVDEMWRRIGDALETYSDIAIGNAESATGGGELGSQFGFSGSHVGAKADYRATDSSDVRYAVQRPAASVAREALERDQRPLILDDFHFIERTVQRQIVRALKPLVFAGIPVILVSVSHRVQDAVLAEPDMTGRVDSLQVDFWNEEELLVIARKGFDVLNVRDQGEMLAKKLAANSYGSPHLMQKFCRELCRENNVREAQPEPVNVSAPPDWDAFFGGQVESASADWFKRLLRGPQERGSGRSQWPMKAGGTLDGYGVTLAAVSETGPKLTLTKDEIKAAVNRVVEGPPPAPHQTTRALQHMTKIAATRVTANVLTEQELDEMTEPDAVPDVQPVLEYIEDGPNSALHLADPFFAFYLRWGAAAHLKGAGA